MKKSLMKYVKICLVLFFVALCLLQNIQYKNLHGTTLKSPNISSFDKKGQRNKNSPVTPSLPTSVELLSSTDTPSVSTITDEIQRNKNSPVTPSLSTSVELLSLTDTPSVSTITDEILLKDWLNDINIYTNSEKNEKDEKLFKYWLEKKRSLNTNIEKVCKKYGEAVNMNGQIERVLREAFNKKKQMAQSL